MKNQTHEKQYGPKQYTLIEPSFTLSYRLKKRLRINKNMLNLEEQQYDDFRPNPSSPNKQIEQLPIPYEMSQTFIKYMLLYRLTAYLCVISIFISLVDIYQSERNKNMLIIINNGVTVAIWIAMLFKFKLYWSHQISKKVIQKQYWDVWHLIDFILTLPHPTIWTDSLNFFFHLAVMFRVILLIKYVIYSSPYCDVRAYRIITVYGLHSNQHFFFAVKSLVANLDVFQVLFIEFISLLYFSHGLYVVSAAGQMDMEFMDCFEVIIVSVPTVGFGQYQMPYIGQKILIFFILIIGAVFNSFITLIMLSQLDMSNEELSSYWLMQKVETRENIENISKKFIQKSMGILKSRSKGQQNGNIQKEELHYSFRNEYRLKKSLYNSISYTDINNLFTYFRQSLIQFRTKSRQVDNMTQVLLRSLNHYKIVIKNKQKSNSRLEEQAIHFRLQGIPENLITKKIESSQQENQKQSNKKINGVKLMKVPSKKHRLNLGSRTQDK